jgi:hypothetical protein
MMIYIYNIDIGMEIIHEPVNSLVGEGGSVLPGSLTDILTLSEKSAHLRYVYMLVYCMYVYIYVRIFISIYTYTYTYIYVYTYIFIHIYAYIPIHIHIV